MLWLQYIWFPASTSSAIDRKNKKVPFTLVIQSRCRVVVILVKLWDLTYPLFYGKVYPWQGTRFNERLGYQVQCTNRARVLCTVRSWLLRTKYRAGFALLC